ncbi:MAG: radical SAM protein [Acidobacteriota bacterium]|nr:radical SAM protein [Acidobacteriota bacterium]MDQ7088778.1 radical SAM protein [Acidobacteriota bacterium]
MTRALGSAWKARAGESWEKARSRRLRVAETFVSLQGEGSRVGRPTAFVRLTGCALRCRWCDSAFAFYQGRWRGLDELEAEILASRVGRVCMTGGEPLLQPSVIPLVRRLARDHGLDVVLETGGDQDISVVPEEAAVVMDIKLPGSGMAGTFDEANLGRLRVRDEVRLVVADRRDYLVARDYVARLRRTFTGEILLGAVWDELEPGTLARWALDDGLDVRLQVQLHKILWPGAEKGV